MDAYSSSGRLVTILYTIHGVPEEEHDEDGTPNAFQLPYPSSGCFRLHELLSRFPPSLSLLGSHSDGPAWQISVVTDQGKTVEVESPASPVYVSSDGCVTLHATWLARAPLYSRRGVQERGLRRRQVSLGGSGEGRRRGGSQGALQGLVESGSETAKSLLSAVGGVVAKAAEKLSHAMLNMGDTVNVEERRFRVVREVAEGGFSSVFLVKDNNTQQEFAMKQVLCFTSESAKDAANELNVLQQLQHPNIVQLVAGCSVATTKGGQRCRQFLFIFPYYPRGTVWDAIANANGAGRWPFSEKQALTLFLAAGEGLMELHQRGLAHWDIKPHNLLLSDDGSPVLMDLGSVTKADKELKDRRAAMLLEEEASKKCSPAYRAPELTQVELGKPIDVRVDVWSMGCVLYALAFGRSPFESPTEGVMKLAILNGRYAFPSDSASPLGHPRFSSSYTSLIRYCLNPEPAQRPMLNDVLTQARKALATA